MTEGVKEKGCWTRKEITRGVLWPKKLILISGNRIRQRKGTRMQTFHKHHQEMHLLLLEISVTKAGKRVKNENSSNSVRGALFSSNYHRGVMEAEGLQEWASLLWFKTRIGSIWPNNILINLIIQEWVTFHSFLNRNSTKSASQGFCKTFRSLIITMIRNLKKYDIFVRKMKSTL